MFRVLSELPRLRFWHSHEKTIEIVGRLVEDGDWNAHCNVQFGESSGAVH